MSVLNLLAFDIGATSGRTMLATIDHGVLALTELTRFPNSMVEIQHKMYWNIYSIFEAIKEGLHVAAKTGLPIDSLGIDTWGVDFAYLGSDQSILGLPRAYRDPYTVGISEEYFQLIPRKEVYALTGIQIMNFNSLYQLFAAKKENNTALSAAKNILFMPDALSYLLTGKKVCEYTIASTSQILNPKTKKLSKELLEVMSIDEKLFPPIIQPGHQIGLLLESIAIETKLPQIPVIAVAGHDTASAIAAIPTNDEEFAYLSSGTWSLMGIEVKEPIISEESYEMNFTNEGGVEGTTRFLKNITGMWILEQCRKEWEKLGKVYSYSELVELSKQAPAFQALIDVDDVSFVHPSSMLEAIEIYCAKTKQVVPKKDADFVRCIFESLALKYKLVLEKIQSLAPFPIKRLHVIGGGAQNKLLNQFTANSIGLPVLAGPSEATALGNILMQAKALGYVDNLQEMRKLIRNSIQVDNFAPQNTVEWQHAYQKYLKITS